MNVFGESRRGYGEPVDTDGYLRDLERAVRGGGGVQRKCGVGGNERNLRVWDGAMLGVVYDAVNCGEYRGARSAERRPPPV